jgi:hypothetical protein
MAKPCGICQSAKRSEIEEALLSGRSVREIAKAFGFSKTRIHAHRQRCIAAAIVKASEGRLAQRGTELVSQIRSLQRKTLETLAEAEEAGDVKAILACVREARENLELEGKLLGQIGTAARPATVNQVAVKIIYEEPRRAEGGL